MQVHQNISLKKYNTFGMAVTAKHFASFGSLDELEEALHFRRDNAIKGILPLMILGGGSNVLFTKDFDGLVLKNELLGIELTKEDPDYVYIKANAGEVWHNLVEYCISNNYPGLENLSLIPGNVGASPMQNIGAYGVELKDVFYELEAYNIEERVVETFSIDECNFGYRESVFKNKYKGKYIILNVTYRLRKKGVFNTQYGAINVELERMGIKEVTIRHISNAIINIRTSKLPNPKVIGNAGSFFKNPQVSKFTWHVIWEQYPDVVAHQLDDMNYKLAAGWLIEKCGWKGFRKGDAGCHEKQALVLVNYGTAKGEDILNLSDEIIASVERKFGVKLEKEVNIV